nr:micrococcal nuclease [Candidatus Cloacimonadota bacterium]
MKYVLIASLIIIILLSIFTCPEKSSIAPDEYPVVRIVDGDTIIAKVDNFEQRIRLIGVDTPESVHPNKDVEDFALEASDFLKEILEGEYVFFRYDQNNVGTNHKDRYGRILAYVYRVSDSLFINQEIIRQGYGHAYTVYPFTLQEDFLKLERDARSAKRGLWAYTDEIPAPSDSIVFYNPGSGKFHRAECRDIGKDAIRIHLEDAQSEGFEPCKICKP